MYVINCFKVFYFDTEKNWWPVISVGRIKRFGTKPASARKRNLAREFGNFFVKFRSVMPDGCNHPSERNGVRWNIKEVGETKGITSSLGVGKKKWNQINHFLIWGESYIQWAESLEFDIATTTPKMGTELHISWDFGDKVEGS